LKPWRKRPHLVITGGAGLLGVNWAAWARSRCRVTLGIHSRQVDLSGTESIRLELSTGAATRRDFDQLEPDLVVHTAGMTNVEACEAAPEEAQRANVDVSVNVATACAAAGVGLVHISTDHLFSGQRPLVDEREPPDPVNVYGRTKAEAEVRVLEAHPAALVVRTNIFGWGPPYRHSFSDVILTALRHRQPITLFEDVFYTPILMETLAQAVHDLVAAGAHGIYHVSGDERLSKHDFGRRISQQFGLDPQCIRRGRIVDDARLVRRPREMGLSNVKARALLGRAMGGMDAQLGRLQEQEREGLPAELRML
jgi:dTDP-4-dehydrorhamnose reductase